RFQVADLTTLPSPLMLMHPDFSSSSKEHVLYSMMFPYDPSLISTHSLPFVAIVFPLISIPLQLSSPCVHFIRSKGTRGVEEACQPGQQQERVADNGTGRKAALPVKVKKGAAGKTRRVKAGPRTLLKPSRSFFFPVPESSKARVP
ncbi:hypothetical protein, partial [Hyphomonas sp.]|uniref:hypothetical protein n=1 Tax=Hyphomonas sp. TaxID=87 RepID=UPI003297B768